jgi:hypothetical protein
MKNCIPEFFLKNKNLDKEKLKSNDKMVQFLNKYDSYQKILNEKIKIGENIKKY